MSATTLTREHPSPRAVGSGSLWKTGVAAAVLSAAVNAGIFALAVAAGVFPSLTFQPEVGAQMSLEPILLVSGVGALAGIAVFALLRRRVTRPVSIFLRLAGAVLLLSFAAPFAVPGTTLVQGMVQNVLHVVVAAFVVWAVLRAQPA